MQKILVTGSNGQLGSEYRQFGWKEGDMPIAENYYKHCISLPIYPTLTSEEQNFVIKSINQFHENENL